MIPGRILGATHTLGPPEGMGEVASLAIRAEEQDGLPTMTSSWYPTPAEIELMQSGAPIHLLVVGVSHPPVSVSVGDRP